MDIQIVSTGQVFYRFDSQIAAVLMALLPEAVREYKKPVPQLENSWTYFLATLQSGTVAIARRKNQQTEYLSATNKEEQIKAWWPDTPANLIAQYLGTPANQRSGIVYGDEEREMKASSNTGHAVYLNRN